MDPPNLNVFYGNIQNLIFTARQQLLFTRHGLEATCVPSL